MGTLRHAASRIWTRASSGHPDGHSRRRAMIVPNQPKTARKKTPEEASEFEREQLRFFLSEGDLAATLATVNPSLAWLPVLSEMKLLENDTQLIAWVERNFSDVDAARDVVNNL